MKKIGILLLAFLSFAQSYQLYSKTNYYKLFHRAFKSKNDQSALIYIKKAYEEDPSNNTYIFWYAYQLRKLKSYEKSAKIFEKLPLNYKPYQVALYLGKIYQHLKNYDLALKTVEQRIFLKAKNKEKWRATLYKELIKISLELEDINKIEQYYPKFEYYAKDQKSSYWVYLKYKVAKFYLKFAEEKTDKDENADVYFRKSKQIADSGLGKYKKYYKWKDYIYVKNAANYWFKNPQKRKQAYKHKILVLVFKHTNTRFKDFKGIEKHVKSSISDAYIKEFPKYLKTMKKLIFYFSRGAIVLDFKIQVLDSTIRDIRSTVWRGKASVSESVNVLSPVIETAKPSAGAVFYKNRNKYDTFMTVFSSKDITGTCTGGLSGRSFVSYALRSKKLRGKMNMASTSFKNYRILVHEFFHNVEGMYRIRPAHLYKQAYKALWPAWYKEENEFYYYEQCFRRRIETNPQKYEHFKLRKNSDDTDLKTFQLAQKLAKKYSIAERKRASEYKIEGSKFYRRRNYLKATQLFEMAYKTFPFGLALFQKTAYCYYKQKNYNKAKFFYEKAFSLGDKGALNMLAYLNYKQKNYPLAAKQYSYLVLSFPKYKGAESALNLAAFIYCYKEKNYKRAERLLKKGLKTVLFTDSKKKAASFFYYAYALAANSKRRQALFHLKKAKDLGHRMNYEFYKRKFSK